MPSASFEACTDGIRCKNTRVSHRGTDDGVELYSALLGKVPGLTGLSIKNLREAFEQGEYHPLDGQATSDF